MNDLKKIPIIIDKTTIRGMFIDATDREIDEVIEKVQRYCRGKKYNRFLKKINYKEFRYIVALLWNPQGYVPVLTKEEQKELQNEIDSLPNPSKGGAYKQKK